MNLPDPIPSDYFQPIVSRMAKARWIKSAHESDAVYRVEFTELGHKRMRRHVRILQPLFAQAENCDRTFFEKVFHDLTYIWMQFRILFTSLELQPPKLTYDDIGKLILNARLYGWEYPPKTP